MTFENNAKSSPETSLTQFQGNRAAEEAIASMLHSRGDKTNPSPTTTPTGANDAHFGDGFVEFKSNNAAPPNEATTTKMHQCSSTTGRPDGDPESGMPNNIDRAPQQSNGLGNSKGGELKQETDPADHNHRGPGNSAPSHGGKRR